MDLDSVLYQDNTAVDKKLDSFGDTTALDALRSTAALSVLEAIEKYIVALQENNIPYGKMYLAVTPQGFMDIRSLGVARDSGDLDGGRQLYFAGNADGGYGTGLGSGLANSFGKIHDTLEYMGCTIIKSNHVMQTDQTGTGLGETKYGLDFATAKIKGVMWVPEAVAALSLQGLKVDSVADVRRNTDFTVASMMAGTGVLRPECAAVISGVALDAQARATLTTALGSIAE
jgi:hypothetical protein